MITVLSLGAGVQSSTLALMAEAGEIEKPDVAIFADTGAEPAPVYRHLEWLKTKLSFPVETVSAGNLTDRILESTKKGGRRNDGRPPFFVRNPDGSRGILRRQCTQDYKLDPIRRKVRELIGLKKGQRGPKSVEVRQIIGISLDEQQRMKLSGNAYVENVYPLVDRRITRGHCLEWMADKGHPKPPKSACVFCPYRRDPAWRELKEIDPEGFDLACEVDRAIRSPEARESSAARNLGGELYVHDSLRPLAEVDFSPIESVQAELQFGMQNECEGMCGL